ncbi:MAG: carboxypeptidase-like regulatory domain-containing protein [Marinoscillum sp.]
MSAYAQETISGKVTDENGEGLPGVTLQVKGTSTGTVTDIDGKYSLSVSPDAEVVVSFIGYIPQTISINGRSVINVALDIDIAELSEVVVIGYGSVRKSDITGSVSSVKAEELQS